MIVLIMIMTDEGQISVDFLLGIGIFLLGFGFVVQFIPSLFVSTSGGGDLNSVAYRTANILAEDPGWWKNNTMNRTDWEIHIENLSRIGLAADDSGTRQTLMPRMLNKTKIEQALNLSISNKTMFATKLGLYDMISGSRIDYGYNITIKPIGNPMIINGSSGSIIFGENPTTSQDVYKITRQVLVERGNIASFKADELTANSTNNNTAMIDVSGPQYEDVILQITNLTANFTGTKLINVSNPINPLNLSIPDNYIAYNRTNISDFNYFNTSISLENSTDTLRLIFNHTLFPINTTYQLELNFTQINFNQGTPINYTDKVEPLYEPSSLVVEVWT